jgi:hypothetical protein
MPDATWAVRDGRGRTLTAVEFAQRTGDLGAARRIQRETAGARSMSLALTLGGGALAVSGLGLLLARNAGAPAWSSYEPDVSDYRTNAQYFEALAQAEADYAAAQEKHDIVKGDRVWIAGFLAGSGVITMGVAPFAGRGVSARRDVTALYWSKEEADALIVAYNDSVRRQVGLPDPTPVAAPPAPQDEEEEEEEEEDPEADPPEDSPPEPPPPAPDPAGPSGARAPGIQLTPVLAPGWTGLTGTF